MKSIILTMVLASVLGGGFVALGGGKVRGNKGAGFVNQEWVNSTSLWHAAE